MGEDWINNNTDFFYGKDKSDSLWTSNTLKVF